MNYYDVSVTDTELMWRWVRVVDRMLAETSKKFASVTKGILRLFLVHAQSGSTTKMFPFLSLKFTCLLQASYSDQLGHTS